MGTNSSTIKGHKANYNHEFIQRENDENYWKTTKWTSNDNSQTSSNVEGCCASPKGTEDQPAIVIAIDFGTTFTGYAYSFRNKRSLIETENWVLGENLVPTDVLLKPDKTIDSFGRKAQYKYAGLVLRKKHDRYRLFSRFNRVLCMNEDLKCDTKILDNDGMAMPALEFFTMVIRRMTENALDMVKSSLLGDTSVIKDSILILTIPAIWSDSARQFIHEVCVNAGIPEKQLRLVLEPEAVAIYCRNELLYRSHSYKSMLPIGAKYILADLGGETVDFCVHDIIENNRSREIFRATGGAIGGTYVDDQFIQALIVIFGSDVFRKFQREQFLDSLTLVEEFEKSKQNFDKESDAIQEIVITVPSSLQCMFLETTECMIEDIVRQGSYTKSIEFCGGKLIFKRELMELFFSKSVQAIISCLQEIFNQCKNEDIKSILLVGGYAEYKYVTDKIKKYMAEFGVLVIVVADPGLSVMKGAVMLEYEDRNTVQCKLLGYEDRKIVQHKSRVTYGFSVAKPFIEGVHPEKYIFERDGEYWCGNIFDKFIEKDQYVEHGQEFKTTASIPRRLQKSKTENVSEPAVTAGQCGPIYCSEKEECKEVGKVITVSPEREWPGKEVTELHFMLISDIPCFISEM